MKTQTIKTAIRLEFDFEGQDFETKESFEELIVDFLNENVNLLPRINERCEVTGSGNRQQVSHGDFESFGEIIDWGYYHFKKRQRAYHSNFLRIDEKTGNCYNVNLYDMAGGNNE
jgi:hypothetical protein